MIYTSLKLLLFFLQNSSSVALLHKHLQLLLPHATEIYTRSATLIKESSWNGSIREKLQGDDQKFLLQKVHVPLCLTQVNCILFMAFHY